MPVESVSLEITTRPVAISASVMCANLGRLEAEVLALEEAGVDRLHFDVMDGHFVPNITLGVDVLRALRPLTRLPFDVHLMTDHPEVLLGMFAQAGADCLIVHAEACPFLHRTVREIHALGRQAGVALNPVTPPTALGYIADELDRVLVMSVDPGFAGQPFIPAVIRKVADLRRLLDEQGATAQIEVDGAINRETLSLLAAAGATVFVGGTSGLFLKHKSYREALVELRTVIGA